MKSVLLGGLKVFLINDGGFPLSAPGGRAKFFKAGTSTPEPVYSDIDLTEGTALGPVVYTDALGALPAIWLKTDRLYKVVVEQKVSDDPETWTVLWEVDNVGEFVPASSEVASAPSAVSSSITELKELDHSEHTTATVLGYYAPGDWGEPSTFVWDVESTLRDDGGSVIRPNDVSSGDAGRWLQVLSGDVIDVRKFGAIPDIVDNSDVTAKVVNAVNYAQRNSSRSRPLTVAFVAPGKYEFGGDFDFTQYADFVDLSDNSHHKLNWLIGEDVVFKGENSDFTISSNTVCLTREALIEGTHATLSVEGGGAIKVDPAWWGNKACSVSDCYVECHSVTTNNKRFERCSVNSNRMFGAGIGYVTLVDMDFSEEWFASNFDWSHLVLSGTAISVYDCSSANTYIDIKNAQGDYDYGDLDEQTVSNKTLGAGCVVENAEFDNVSIGGKCEMHNVSGTVVVRPQLELNAIDCWLEIIGSFSADLLSVELRRGSIKSSLLVVVHGLAYFSNSVVDAVITAFDEIVFETCEIRKNINQKPAPSSGRYVAKGRIENCRFTTGKHIISNQYDTGQNTLIEVKWLRNFGEVAYPIDITGVDEFLDLTENHNYQYSGNTGTFMPERISNYKSVGFTVINMTTGWRIHPSFNDNGIFLVGKKKLAITVRSTVASNGFGSLGASATKIVEVTSGYISGSDISIGVMFFDAETETHVNMKDLATIYPDSVTCLADVEVL